MDHYQLKFLRGRKLTVFQAIADCIIPEDEYSESAGNLKTAAVTDWSMQRLPGDLRSKILLFVTVIDLLGIFFGFKRFPELGASDKIKLLKWLENNKISALRMGFFGIKTYICMGYYTREEMWPSFNYKGPILKDRPYQNEEIRLLSQGKLKITE